MKDKEYHTSRTPLYIWMTSLNRVFSSGTTDSSGEHLAEPERPSMFKDHTSTKKMRCHSKIKQDSLNMLIEKIIKNNFILSSHNSSSEWL